MNKYLQIISISFIALFSACKSDSVKQEAQPAIFDITTYGAIGDEKTVNTAAIQKAIDECTAGGVVYVPAGNYVTGTLWLKSDIELRIAKDAKLLGSTDINDYSRDNQGSIEAPAFDECLIYAENAKNITITGGGTIDGRGTKDNFPIGKRKAYNDRPMLMRFVDCIGLNFNNITLRDAASWCVHLVNSEDIVVSKVHIDSRVNRNNDGFDLDGCKNILIEDSEIHTGDDAICPKSTVRATENLVVRNCIVSSHTSAFKCGTSSHGGFKNIHIYDCEFRDVGMGAIKLQIVDGGIMENITIENIKIVNSEGPIFIRLGNRGRGYTKAIEQIYKKDAESEGVPVGSIKNIIIRNIDAEVVSEKRDRWGILITGIPGHYVENVLLENIKISYPGGGAELEAKNVVAEDEARYPEQYFFGVLPSWGAYIRHAKNIEFNNVVMSTRAADERQEIVQDDVINFVRK